MARLTLTLAALASIIFGYYLGQHWQRRPALTESSAVVYAAGRSVEYPAGLGIRDDPEASGLWRLFLAADTGVGECTRLLRHYASVFNRLAAWPEIQDNLRLTILAYDRPDIAAVTAFAGGVSWAQVVSAEPKQLGPLSRQLGLLPNNPGTWCSGAGANAILVAPDRTSRALIPYEQAVIMARNISTIIASVE